MTRLNQYALFPISQPNSAFLVKGLLRTYGQERWGPLVFPHWLVTIWSVSLELLEKCTILLYEMKEKIQLMSLN